MEKMPNIDVVGNVSEAGKEGFRDGIRGNLQEDHLSQFSKEQLEELKANEYPKSSEEIYLLNIIKDEIKRIRSELGFETLEISERNFHIISKDLYKKIHNNEDSGCTHYKPQSIFLNANDVRRDLIVFAVVAYHEALHLNEKQKIQYSHFENEPEAEKQWKFYKIGVVARSALKKDIEGLEHEHFVGLSEAIVANEEYKFLKKILEESIFAELKEELKSDEVLEKNIAAYQESKDPIDEMYFFEKNGCWRKISYSKQRETYLYVCQEIAKDKGVNREEIEKEFLRSHFSGNLLDIAKLVEKSFGRGSFRTLGNMHTDNNSAITCLEQLKKNRLSMKKEQKN